MSASGRYWWTTNYYHILHSPQSGVSLGAWSAEIVLRVSRYFQTMVIDVPLNIKIRSTREVLHLHLSRPSMTTRNSREDDAEVPNEEWEFVGDVWVTL